MCFLSQLHPPLPPPHTHTQTHIPLYSNNKVEDRYVIVYALSYTAIRYCIYTLTYTGQDKECISPLEVLVECHYQEYVTGSTSHNTEVFKASFTCK